MKLNREFKVGIIAIISLALLYWGFNFLKGKDLFEEKRTFYAVYDGVDGLSRSRPVTINGFQVGMVEDIYFHPDGSGRLMVKLNMTNDFEISENSLARIYSEDLLGGKSIQLVLGTSPTAAQSGDTLQSDIQLSLTEEVNKQVAPLKQKAEKLIGSIDTVLILVSGFLNEDTRSNFAETFNSLRRSFLTLENTIKTVDNTVSESQDDLQSIFRNLASITGNLENNNEKLSEIFANFNSISDSLARVNFAETFTSLNKTLVSTQKVMERVDKGEGSLGMLVNDKKLYNNLENASDQLDELLKDIKYNPSRYIHFSVFGRSKAYSQEEIMEMEEKREEKEQEFKEEQKGE